MDGSFMFGGLATDEGACPQCGGACTHVHGWNLRGLTDTYACRGCGVTEYHVVASAS